MRRLFMHLLQSDVINDDILEQLERFTLLPFVIFNEQQLLYFNLFFQDALKEDNIDDHFHNIYYDIDHVHFRPHQEIKIKNSFGEIFYFDAKISRVIYQKQPAYFAVLLDISDRRKFEHYLAQVAKLRALIIEISNSILDSTSIETFYNFVLNTTLKAFEKATLGTILVLKDNIFVPAAHVGYSNSINDFRLKVEDSFLFNETHGNMDRVANISDTTELHYYIPVITEYGDEVYIRSSLSAPIYFQGSLYGLVNLDSLLPDAFNEDDIQAIEFISKSIEIAITNRLLYEEKAYLSRYDRLTGLYNRHFFDEYSDAVIKRAQRYGESFHLVMLDVDNLKNINDQHSHLIGDEILAYLAMIIKSNMRESDVFARYGGDEYIGVLFNAEYDALIEKFEALNAELQHKEFHFNNATITTSISYGIATFNNDGTTLYDLIRVADLRMYDYKHQSKGKR